MNELLFMSLGVIALFGLGNLFTTLWQSKFIFFPKPFPQDYRFALDHPFDELNIDVGGAVLHAIRIQAKSGSDRMIIYFHGNSGNLVRWAPIAERYADLGWDVLVFDYRGFGKSSGRLTSDNLYADAEEIHRYVVETWPKYKEILVFGRSMGSAPASYLSSKIQQPRLVLETPFYSMKQLFYDYYPFLPPVFRFRFVLPNHQYLKIYKGAIQIFHGTNDGVVPLRNARKLKKVIKHSDHFLVLSKGNHSNLVHFDKYWAALRVFLK